MSFLDDDLPTLFADFSVTMTYTNAEGNTESGPVILDQPDKSLNMGGMMVQSNEPSIIYITSQFPDLTEGSQVTIDGTAYVLRLPSLLSDGRISSATLRNP